MSVFVFVMCLDLKCCSVLLLSVEQELRQLSVESRDALREIELCQRLLPEVEELQWEIGELRKELMFEQAVSEFYSEQLGAVSPPYDSSS